MAGEIKVDPGVAPATYGSAGAEVSGNRGVGTGVTGAMRPTVGAPLTGMEMAFNGSIDKTSTVTGQGSQFAGGFAAADKDGAGKAAVAGNSKVADDEIGRKPGAGGPPEVGKPGPARLTAGDLAKLVSPYQSAMPAAQTVAPAAMAPAAMAPVAQAVPQMLSAAQAPMQAVQSPIQALLSAPGGAALLQQLLSQGNASNGFDGGPASQQLSGSRSSTGVGGRLHDLARRVMGIPYAWGGGSMSGPSQGISDGGGPADRAGDYRKIGFDCSGLSRYVTAQMYGVEIPRTSQQQYAAGVPVSNPVPGDLVFPRGSFGSGGPGHVQIYLGNGQVLEAPSSGQTVKVSSLQSDSEFRRYVRLV
jgi:cell wall-associated NlpC family hydrolase